MTNIHTVVHAAEGIIGARSRSLYSRPVSTRFHRVESVLGCIYTLGAEFVTPAGPLRDRFALVGFDFTSLPGVNSIAARGACVRCGQCSEDALLPNS